MNLVADESVDQPIVARLRQDGHHVWYVAEVEPSISDDAVLDVANREAAVLLAADKDFGEMVFRQRRFTGGIILIRLAGLSSAHKASIVAVMVRQHSSELPNGFDRAWLPSDSPPQDVVRRSPHSWVRV
jgi:predicted nuclease of predicted toxin-antitoxin system